jgi:predicted 2-oxoglutarate/Fe(II)-dependent dioxygenase YbiX
MTVVGSRSAIARGTGNRIALGQGDALVFPSFVMHRALPVQRGTRWTLVSWLTGREPLQ